MLYYIMLILYGRYYDILCSSFYDSVFISHRLSSAKCQSFKDVTPLTPLLSKIGARGLGVRFETNSIVQPDAIDGCVFSKNFDGNGN